MDAANNFANNFVNNNCPQFVQDGCGCDMCCGKCADCLEVTTPCVEWFADLIWVLGSPLAFPFIFCFDPETNETGGWAISMLQAPCRRPIECCCFSLFPPCGQWYMRRQVLGGDMTKYKLWQGQHDGPHCCARRCPGAPITIQSGTYGEKDCPNCFLCLEVWCLAGVWSVCCAFDVSRRVIKEERGLGDDPTEIRQRKCVAWFSNIAHHCAGIACCACICGCCIQLCAQDSEGAQDLGGELQRASRACWSIVHTIWRGIYSVKVIAIGCMSAQMEHEIKTVQVVTTAPQTEMMKR